MTMIVPDFSVVVLTFNEEVHLPRLLKSLEGLNAPLFILDSGSSDKTIDIVRSYNATVASHPFENHPKQWDYALNTFSITTPWIIGLDSDQEVSHELYKLLQNFRSCDIPSTINGIYFNRKNYFRGRWIKYGGYFPKYLLKMFRSGHGRSDLNENMDHRFIIEGEAMIWKNGYLKEENFKENSISFWIDKHNRYSDLVAVEEVERRAKERIQQVKANYFGNPDEKISFYKKMWRGLPLYVRPFIYFFYRFVIKLGILDGKEGWIFHFLQGFWFRLVVDIKIDELLKKYKD